MEIQVKMLSKISELKAKEQTILMTVTMINNRNIFNSSFINSNGLIDFTEHNLIQANIVIIFTIGKNLKTFCVFIDIFSPPSNYRLSLPIYA